MRYLPTRRPSLAGLVAAVALLVACLSVTGALASSNGVRVVVGEADLFKPGAPVTVPPGSVEIAEAPCPAGDSALSGGFDENGSATISLVGSKALATGSNRIGGWKVEVVNPPLGQEGQVTAFALCAHFDRTTIPGG